MYYWRSPAVIIDQYTGASDGRSQLLPNWINTVQTECRFWQSRILMLEMLLYFAHFIPHNSGVAKQVYSWCHAMSVSCDLQIYRLIA